MAGKRSRGPRSYRPVWFYFSNFPQYELGYYGQAFLEAARTLMRSLRRRRGFSNVSAAPVLFTYRHAIELLMHIHQPKGLTTSRIRANRDIAQGVQGGTYQHRCTPPLSQVEQVVQTSRHARLCVEPSTSES